MEIKLKRTSPNAIIPTQSHVGDAGYDLYACDIPNGKVEIAPHDTCMISTGIALAIPKGYAGLLFSRSGIATKRGIRPATAVSVLDSPYRGTIIYPAHNDSADWQTVENGERIGQLVVVPVVALTFNEVDELEETERGTGGFGSTGTK